MSKRPIEAKQRRKAARLIRKNQNALPAFFSPVDWVIQHGHAKNKAEARRLIENCRLVADDQPIGVAIEAVPQGDTFSLTTVAADKAPFELRSKAEVISYDEAAERFLNKEEDEQDS